MEDTCGEDQPLFFLDAKGDESLLEGSVLDQGLERVAQTDLEGEKVSNDNDDDSFIELNQHRKSSGRRRRSGGGGKQREQRRREQEAELDLLAADYAANLAEQGEELTGGMADLLLSGDGFGFAGLHDEMGDDEDLSESTSSSSYIDHTGESSSSSSLPPSRTQLRKLRHRDRKDRRAEEEAGREAEDANVLRHVVMFKRSKGRINASIMTHLKVQNQKVRTFVQHYLNCKLEDGADFESYLDAEDTLMTLDYLPNDMRKRFTKICTMYNVVASPKHNGDFKVTQLTITPTAFIPDKWESLVDTYFALGDSFTLDYKLFQALKKGKFTSSNDCSKKSKRNVKKAHAVADSRVAVPIPYTQVGQDAAPVSESNKGHAMLKAMGWSLGEGLGGAGQGINEPIAAIVRGKRDGLGRLGNEKI